jgi:hypothetical protein
MSSQESASPPAPATVPLYIRLLATSPDPQTASPLWSVVPPEIRSNIFAHALADYPDPSPDVHWGENTCYTRPSYFAPRRTDTALLRACRAAYAEGWHLPALLREQVCWLTAPDRRPSGHDWWRPLQTLKQVAEAQGAEAAEVARLRVFAQMVRLEGRALSFLFDTPFLAPRQLTLTIRHTDWWWWEHEQPLRFEAGWLAHASARMPASVREFIIELESLEKKKVQVDAIATQMRQKWFFKRRDGAILYPDLSDGGVEVSRWRGTSTWGGETWTRDETQEGCIDYYIVAVAFRLDHAVQRRGGVVNPETRAAAEAGDFDSRRMRLAVEPGPEGEGVGHHGLYVFESDSDEIEIDDGEEWDDEDVDEDMNMDLNEVDMDVNTAIYGLQGVNDDDLGATGGTH